MNDHPNLLLIFADQLRWDFLGCYGGPACSPNLDALAAEGMRFTDCVCNVPVCAASRCSLATGLQPRRMGAMTNGVMLQPHHRTYYQQLRDHGYHVGCTGKLDLAKPLHDYGADGAPPRAYAWGFTRPCDIEGQGYLGMYDHPIGCYGEWLKSQGLWDKYHADYVERKKKFWIHAPWDSVMEADHTHDAFVGKKALEWLETYDAHEPWHHFVSFVGPHDPYDPPTSYAETWRDRDVPERVVSMEGKPRGIMDIFDAHDPGFVRHTRRQYCAKMEMIDSWIGKLITKLKERGEYENTYVFFASDHGDMMGDHGLYAKNVPYEASIHVPLIARGPGIPAGSVSHALVELNDLNPTLCELAGVPKLAGIDARAFAHVLRGETTEHREFTLTTHEKFSCARTRTAKYIRNFNDIEEFYDLAEDPYETRNLLAGEATGALSFGADQEFSNVAKRAATLKSRMNRGMLGDWRWGQ